MTARKLPQCTTEVGTSKVCVFRDAEFNEYQVRLYKDGKEEIGSRYYTDDRNDAILTRNHIAATLSN